MSLPTQPLRDEHKDLLPHIEALRTTADSIGEAPVEAVRHNVDAAHEFLTHHLLPHAEAEEKALYPTVAKLIGGAQATATMSRDHVEVGRLTDELGRLRPRMSGGELDRDTERALRAVLYGLATLVKVHFDKEEEVYLPILDRGLTEAEARAMFEAMEAAAGEAKARAS
jgi:hemerythrin-like domain-containing protein